MQGNIVTNNNNVNLGESIGGFVYLSNGNLASQFFGSNDLKTRNYISSQYLANNPLIGNGNISSIQQNNNGSPSLPIIAAQPVPVFAFTTQLPQ